MSERGRAAPSLLRPKRPARSGSVGARCTGDTGQVTTQAGARRLCWRPLARGSTSSSLPHVRARPGGAFTPASQAQPGSTGASAHPRAGARPARPGRRRACRRRRGSAARQTLRPRSTRRSAHAPPPASLRSCGLVSGPLSCSAQAAGLPEPASSAATRCAQGRINVPLIPCNADSELPAGALARPRSCGPWRSSKHGRDHELSRRPPHTSGRPARRCSLFWRHVSALGAQAARLARVCGRGARLARGTGRGGGRAWAPRPGRARGRPRAARAPGRPGPAAPPRRRPAGARSSAGRRRPRRRRRSRRPRRAAGAAPG
jgi:hypothetical protein